MDENLDRVLEGMGAEYGDMVLPGARHYMEVNIGKRADSLGFPDLAEKYRDAYAVVPLRAPVSGMKVRIDGRTFVGYAQYPSGIAVPGYVARDSSQALSPYVANDSMILNFA